MSLAFTAEQRELQSTVRRLFQSQITSSYLRKIIEGDTDRRELQAKINELGLHISFLSEELEGLGLGFKDLSILAFEGGRALLPEWSILNLLGGALFVSRILSKERRAKAPFNKALVDGNQSISFALFNGVDGRIRFIAGGTQLVLMFSGEEAQIFEIGSASFVKEQSLDLTLNYQSLKLSTQPIFKLSREESALLRAALNIIAASEMAGLCERAIEMTIEQVAVRKQFDVPVGGFQAVQHKLADMHVAAESLRALSNFAAWACDASPEQIALASRAAITQACEQGAEIIESAIQLHGGIGFTWEHDLHLYLRRARTITALYGNTVSAADLLSAVH